MCNSNSFSGRTAGRRTSHSQEWFQSPQRHAKLTGLVQRREIVLHPTLSSGCPVPHLAEPGPPKLAISLLLNLRPKKTTLNTGTSTPRSQWKNPRRREHAEPRGGHAERAACAAHHRLCCWGGGAAEHTRADHTLRMMPRAPPPGLLPKASPLSGSPRSPRQSLGRWSLSASEAMVGRHRGPTAPDSRELPQPPADGGTEPAGHVCRHSQGGGGSPGTKAEWKPWTEREREPILAGTEMAAELPPADTRRVCGSAQLLAGVFP